MAWIACDARLFVHPKTRRLALKLGWDIGKTAGSLLSLWCWCMEFAPDGDLRPFSPEEIAAAMLLPEEEGERTVALLVETAWLDVHPYFRIHDWWTQAGLFLKGRYKRNRGEWERIRGLYEPEPVPEPPPACSGTAPEQLLPTKPNPPRPYQTKHHQPGMIADGTESGREELDELKREIFRSSGVRRLSPREEEGLRQLLTIHGSGVRRACEYLHAGVGNPHAYLKAVLDKDGRTEQLSEEAARILNSRGRGE